MDAPDGPHAHRPFEDMAVAHVLGGLDSDQGRVFRSHLLECTDCRARVGELRAIASELATVERDERRERSARAVEVKRREEAEEDEVADLAGPWQAPRWVVAVLVAVAVVLGAYAFVVRGNVARLEQALDQRLAASAALEHGEELPVRYRAPGVDATAKANGEDVVLLLEGLEAERTYGVYLVDDTPSGAVTVYRHPLVPRDGAVFLMLPLVGAEDRLLVTAPEGGVTLDPDGQRIFEAVVPVDAGG